MVKVVKRLTEMINWRGGRMEFVRKEFTNRRMTLPPWYVIEISGGAWKNYMWYKWIDYQGPPKIFLTRRMAEICAKALREQYKYKCRIKVVPIGPINKYR